MLTPLFINGNFNRDRKRVRMLFYKTISSVNATYDLYIRANKTPDNNDPKSENAKYSLFVLLNGWIIPCSMTERNIEDRSLWNIVTAKLYGSKEARNKLYDELHAGSQPDDAVEQQIQKERELEDSLREDDSMKAEYLRKCFDRAIDNYIKAREGEGNFPDFVGEVENCMVLSDKRKKKLDEEYNERRRVAAEKERVKSEEEARKAEEEVKNAEVMAAIL